jgi:hypothetical protein
MWIDAWKLSDKSGLQRQPLDSFVNVAAQSFNLEAGLRNNRVV